MESLFSQQEEGPRATYCNLYRYWNFTLASISAALAYLLFCHQEPIMANRLQQDFHMTQAHSNYFFMIFPATYIPCCLIIPNLAEIIDRRYILLGGAFMGCVSLLLNGPSNWIGMPYTKGYLVAGQIACGFGQSMAMIPALKEMTETVKPYYAESKHKKVAGLCGGVMNCSLGAGQFVGPILSTFLLARVGYRSTEDYISIMYALFFLVFLFTSGILSSCRKKKTDDLDFFYLKVTN